MNDYGKSDLKVSELIDKRDELADKILELVEEFTEETGVTVAVHVKPFDMPSWRYDVVVELKL